MVRQKNVIELHFANHPLHSYSNTEPDNEESTQVGLSLDTMAHSSEWLHSLRGINADDGINTLQTEQNGCQFADNIY